MIYGTGRIEARLERNDGTIEATIILPRPDRRDEEDWPRQYVTLGPDSTGKQRRKFLGCKFFARYVWILDEESLSDAANIIRVANWSGEGRVLRIWPHEDIGQQERCEVLNDPYTPYNGTVLADEIVLELGGLDYLPNKPNALFDRCCENEFMSSTTAIRSFGS